MLSLLFASAIVAAACAGTPRTLSAPPAVLPDAVAAQNLGGVSIADVSLTVDASGAVTGVQSGAGRALAPVVESWGKRVKFASRSPKCGASPVQIDSVDFYPASSGVVGIPRIAGGVDFDDFSYSGGPGNCTHVTLRDGTASDPEDEYEAFVEDLFAGTVSGVPVAVVVLRCEYHGHGFDAEAQVFSVAGAKAIAIGTLGQGGMPSADSALPPWPGGWIHVGFRDGLLYADVWDRAKACNRNADWTSTAYAVRAGKLAALRSTRHHRAGVPAVGCETG